MFFRLKQYLTPYEEGFNERLRDPEFRKLWNAGAARRAVTSALMKERIKQKMSRDDLAKIAELKQPNIAHIESGEVGVTVDTLGKLAQAFGKTLEINFTTSNTL